MTESDEMPAEDNKANHLHDEARHGEHGHDDHGHSPGHGHGGHGHTHGFVDPSISSSGRGLWAVKWSFIGLFVTAGLQLVVVVISHSVALLADTIHNFGDAATAIPLGIAFLFARRPPTRRFTYGFGRVEDLAGLAVVLTIFASAATAFYQSIHRLLHPQTVSHIGAIVIASIIGFLGNELVAMFRIRVGKEIGSAALVADGYHARTDGWTSLAVLVGAVGVYLGYPKADPIIGLLITVAILGIVWQSVRTIFARMLDGVDPDVVTELRHAAAHVDGVEGVSDVQARWIGHQLHAEVSITVAPEISVTEGHELAKQVEHQLRDHLKFLSEATVHVDPSHEAGDKYHLIESHAARAALGVTFIAALHLWAPTAIAQAANTAATHVSEESEGSAAWVPQVLGSQVNVIGQHLASFDSPYRGKMSLTPDGSDAISHVYGIYVGASLRRGLDGYLDIEMARGKGISHASGVAGVTNGDVLRQGTADLGNGPYVARAFLRYRRGLGDIETDTLTRGPDQLPAIISAHRLEIWAGKFAVSDLFDVNRYANSTRLEFMNWGLFQNTAWDFAADTRGYTNGVALAWVTPLWTLRLGSFQMPREANGNKFDAALDRARGDNAELTLAVLPRDGILRLLGYINHARMGNYREAIARAAPGTPPDIVADDRPGRLKRGVGLNLEQPLADNGETGVFARWGWNDGRNESFAFTEVEGHLSAGVQLAGNHWGRSDDRVAVAGLQHEIWTPHRAYLARGGTGFLLGDGALNYGPEQVIEGYYRAQIGPYVEVGPDVQRVSNPGYNRDRGPAVVTSLRLNLRY